MPEDSKPEPECHQCGNCCRGFSLGCKQTLETSIRNCREERGPDTEEQARGIALLRRIMIHKPKGKGSFGRGYQNYRCRMLWHNKFTGKWECLIHESKPSMCKKFKPGHHTLNASAACRAGMSPDDPFAEVNAAIQDIKEICDSMKGADS